MVRISWHLFIGFPLLGAMSAYAQTQDTFNMRAGVSVLNADNFFRSPAATATSERVISQNIGVNVAVPYSLQRFELDASLIGNQHQNFSNFDYTAQNYNAAWWWSLTPRLRGSITSTRGETLNAANDNVDPNQRNKVTTQSSALSAAYELGGPWQLTAGVSNSATINERAVIGQTDNRSGGFNLGVRYAPASGNSVDYSLQVARGNSANDYSSTTHNISSAWTLSGNSSLNVRLAHLQQKFSIAPQFDYTGLNGGVSFSWRVTGKTSLTAGWQRDLAGYQTAGTTHTKTDAFTLSPSWLISAKSSLKLQYRNAVRDDQGNPSGIPSDRQDRLRDLSLTYGWQPRPSATLSATMSESTRSSSVSNADFIVRQLSLSAQFTF